jgi:acyl-CoA reductase-like NAD-dependent aldehyde dehydrogenase
MPAGNEEIFGPVLSIVRVATVDEAIAIENANPYGNASPCTRRAARSRARDARWKPACAA